MDFQTLVMALVMGLLYWICNGTVGYTLWMGFGTPFAMGLFAGLIYGDVTTGIILAGSIKLIFLGVIAPGGQLPSDENIAAACIIPLALKTGMSTEVALTLAVPVAMLGAFLYNMKKIVNIRFVQMAEDSVEQMNFKKLWRSAFSWPMFANFLLFFMPVFLVNIFGENIVQPVLDIIPEWLMHGLEIAGGILPAIGFSMIMVMIGKKKFIPFFIIGYFVTVVTNLNILISIIIAISIAIILVTTKREMRGDVSRG
ncbi:PTS mannose/fructose/sorbose/N-acetylgalactosamine transporter subunit IIC [Candidatus Enterococcus ferrettii]|uniref:PTS system, D-glucosaminate-specific IIC component n=1 Tax=Candidatus Enterococcus ferrettii TaxID=2815324 RepID=A0ABV0EKA9_9ENTE|nr:PTS sugar transporter subunit IIC [Enterococcus sp. 665A]MBO1341613.1 PTS sugar transporter subunit IIC [Enterococcus sp. 665A]